jgi:hypothetical protein
MWGCLGPTCQKHRVKRSRREKPRRGQRQAVTQPKVRRQRRRDHHERSQVLQRMVKPTIFQHSCFDLKIRFFDRGVLWFGSCSKILLVLIIPRSNNMLYPREDKDTRTLLYACQTCEHQVVPVFLPIVIPFFQILLLIRGNPRFTWGAGVS